MRETNLPGIHHCYKIICYLELPIIFQRKISSNILCERTKRRDPRNHQSFEVNCVNTHVGSYQQFKALYNGNINSKKMLNFLIIEVLIRTKLNGRKPNIEYNIFNLNTNFFCFDLKTLLISLHELLNCIYTLVYILKSHFLNCFYVMYAQNFYVQNFSIFITTLDNKNKQKNKVNKTNLVVSL